MKQTQIKWWEHSMFFYTCFFLSPFTNSSKFSCLSNVFFRSGYMPPEYAVHGSFSVKSDVFSFGVIVLEIISGRKNRGFRDPHNELNLLGHVSSKWKFNNILIPNKKSSIELNIKSIYVHECKFHSNNFLFNSFYVFFL